MSGDHHSSFTSGIPAWLCKREASPPLAPPNGAPDLRPTVLHEDGGALTVEVVNRLAMAPKALLYVQARGLFAIVATLHRGQPDTRVFLRLRAWDPWSDAGYGLSAH